MEVTGSTGAKPKVDRGARSRKAERGLGRRAGERAGAGEASAEARAKERQGGESREELTEGRKRTEGERKGLDASEDFCIVLRDRASENSEDAP